MENEQARTLWAEFDASPKLNHSKLASYEWGTGELSFSPEGSLRKQLFLNSMVGLSQGVTQLESEEDLVCLISLVHEYRHFQQDFLTGVGNWDYVSRTATTIERLSDCKHFSADGSVIDGYHDKKRFQQLESDKTIFGRQPAEEISILGDFMEQALGAPREYAPLFTTRRILETDAVLYTENMIRTLKMSQKSGDALRNISATFECLLMPEPYSRTITFCLSELLQNVIDETPLLEKVASLKAALRVILNLSLMHPSPEYLTHHGQDWCDYLPGVRFLRLFRATAGRMKDPTPPEASAESFDAGLCARSGYKYPTYRDGLRSWHSYLRNMPANPFPELTKARASVVEKKLFTSDGSDRRDSETYGPVFQGEAAFSLVEYDLPLFATRTDGGEQPILMTGRSIVGNEYAADRKRATAAWRLSGLAAGARKFFACPMTSLAYCSAQTERCLTPFGSLEELPTASACYASTVVRDKNLQILTL